MKINLIAVGTHMPKWVQSGFLEYQKRLPSAFNFSLIEINASKRTKNSTPKILMTEEGKKIIQIINTQQGETIALDVQGKAFNTENFSTLLQNWLFSGKTINLLIGGPDGLSEECLNASNSRWSLSELTLPHPLVRIVLVEQLYRAWTLIQGHPYHRA